MATSYAWVSRCRAYDEYWDKYAEEDRKARIERANAKFVDEALAGCYVMLQAGLQEIEALRKRQAMSPDKTAKLMSEKDSVLFVEKAIKNILLLQGKPTERSEVNTSVKDLSLEELDAHIAKLERLGK